eukprot:6519578-Prymnesium_polylepis.1
MQRVSRADSGQTARKAAGSGRECTKIKFRTRPPPRTQRHPVSQGTHAAPHATPAWFRKSGGSGEYKPLCGTK